MREKCYYIIYNYYSLSVILSLILLIFLDFLFGITFKNLRFQLPDITLIMWDDKILIIAIIFHLQSEPYNLGS